MIHYIKVAGLVFIFVWFFGGGVGHFTNTSFFLAIVPPWVPYPLAAVYLSGGMEIVLSILLFVSKIRAWVGWGIIALTIAVTPANIHMWMNPELFPEVSPSLLSIRLVVQVFLIALIWWCTRDEKQTRSSEVVDSL
ncbi:MAG: putative membrane protein [Flavobacterium sp.]